MSSITKLLIILTIFNILSQAESSSHRQKEKKASARDSLKYLSQIKNYPDELEEVSKILSNQAKECFSEIAQIYTKDFYTNEGKNPYLNKKNKDLAEKYFEKISNQIWKKLNKLSFLESKNFTGVRWIEFKSSNNTELKRMMDSHLGLLSDYMQKNFLKNSPSASNKKEKENSAAKGKKANGINNNNSKSNSAVVYMNLPEIIVDSYQYFYSKINELKKFFSKFYFFKAIGKFNSCVASKEKYDVKAVFADKLKSGQITIKTLLENLKDIYTNTLELLKAQHMAEFVKALKKLLLILKTIPGM